MQKFMLCLILFKLAKTFLSCLNSQSFYMFAFNYGGFFVLISIGFHSSMNSFLHSLKCAEKKSIISPSHAFDHLMNIETFINMINDMNINDSTTPPWLCALKYGMWSQMLGLILNRKKTKNLEQNELQTRISIIRWNYFPCTNDVSGSDVPLPWIHIHFFLMRFYSAKMMI